MHLNSNDIFTQIGLVVSPQQEYSFEEQTLYTVYLQIQLSEGNNELLEIRNHDNPHIIATSFCRKHKLNELAVGIVENKIREAMRKQQQRVFGRHKTLTQSYKQQREPQNQKKTQTNKNRQPPNIINRNKQIFQLKPQKPMSNEKSRSKSKTNTQEQPKRSPLIRKTSNSPNNNQPKKTDNSLKKKQMKTKLHQSPSKSQVKKSTNSPNKNQSKSNNNKQINNKNPDQTVQQFNIHQNKKKNPNIGNQLYAKAMTRMKTQQDLRIKKKEKDQKDIQKQLTFQPKINPISAKIVEFRRQNPYPYEKTQKQNKKQQINQQIAQNQQGQLRQCTFKPQINKVSDLILQNNQPYSIDYDHFTALYKQAQTKNSRAIAKIQKQTQSLFQPKINPKSAQVVTETFQQRLQRSLIQKKKIIQTPLDQSSYTFQPKIGRAPKQQKNIRNQPQFWNNLHSEKLKRNKTANVINEQQQIQPIPISNASHYYYQNLIEKRMNDVFYALDGDQDGFISPQNISIQRLTKNQLVFLKPIFQEMDELQAVLNQIQFKRALGIMLSEADPYTKGLFLSDKPKIQEKSNFIPQINSKSKQIAHSRLVDSCGNIHEQLYQIGLKNIQKKQYHLQKQRAKIQEKQLQGCSFKPQLNNTSKYYIQKLLGKKINEKFDDEPIFR